MSGFWKGWLNVWCLAVAAFGLVLAGGGIEATSFPADLLLTAFGSHGAPDWAPHLRFSVALMGAVTLGWAITFAALFMAAHRLGAEAGPVWRLATLGVLVWFGVDSALSVATGFALNAVSNTVLLITYLIPVIASGVLAKTSRDGA